MNRQDKRMTLLRTVVGHLIPKALNTDVQAAASLESKLSGAPTLLNLE